MCPFVLHKSYMIYHTDQVTKPIKQWSRLKVAIDDMPIKLKLEKSSNRFRRNPFSSDYAPVHDNFHFLRISAVNSQLGEGPYSNIVELKRIKKSIIDILV